MLKLNGQSLIDLGILLNKIPVTKFMAWVTATDTISHISNVVKKECV